MSPVPKAGKTVQLPQSNSTPPVKNSSYLTKYLFAIKNYGRLFGKLEKGDAAVVKSVTFRNEFEGKRLNFSTLSDT